MGAYSLDLVRQFVEQTIPFNRLLGMKLVSFEQGEVVTCVPFQAALIGDVWRPALHGGVISAMIDATGGAAAFSKLEFGDKVSTVDLRVDYLRPGQPADLYCRSKLVRLGNRVAAVAASAYHLGEEDAPVAMSMAVYNIRRKSEDDARRGQDDGVSPKELLEALET